MNGFFKFLWHFIVRRFSFLFSKMELGRQLFQEHSKVNRFFRQEERRSSIKPEKLTVSKKKKKSATTKMRGISNISERKVSDRFSCPGSTQWARYLLTFRERLSSLAGSPLWSTPPKTGQRKAHTAFYSPQTLRPSWPTLTCRSMQAGAISRCHVFRSCHRNFVGHSDLGKLAGGCWSYRCVSGCLRWQPFANVLSSQSD